jgi:hypothetical protein
VSDYTVLRAASLTLRSLLKTNITDSSEPDLGGVPIDLRSPDELREDNVTVAVSTWLYQIALQPDMLNTPPQRLSDNSYEPRPLPLELLYLITALQPEPGTQLTLTGRVLQLIDDYARLRGAQLQDTLIGSSTELRLSLDTTSLTNTAELWYSLQTPFHVSVPVRMQVVAIDSVLPSTVGPPVLSRRSVTTELIGGSA